MSSCILEHIPSRLHWSDRPLIEEFSIGDILYRRCLPSDLENPFSKISLAELSNNLAGRMTESVISYPEDVLLNTSKDQSFTNYATRGMVVCELMIKSLREDNRYEKQFSNEAGEVIGEMELIHDPIECMFPHCVFRITIEGTVVTMENYDSTLNLKKHKKIRVKIREELAFMIVTRTIDQKGSPNQQ